jgi:excisionase family DNA binding protein
MPPKANERLAVSPRELASQAGVSHDFVYKAIASGELVARKWGRRTLILATDAQRYLDSLPRMRSAAARRATASNAEIGHR